MLCRAAWCVSSSILKEWEKTGSISLKEVNIHSRATLNCGSLENKHPKEFFQNAFLIKHSNYFAAASGKKLFSLMQRFDILLIEVVRPFVFNDFVKKAALPVLKFPAGTPVVVTGWGLTSEGWSISWCATGSTVVLSLNVELSGSSPSLKSIGFIS